MTSRQKLGLFLQNTVFVKRLSNLKKSRKKIFILVMGLIFTLIKFFSWYLRYKLTSTIFGQTKHLGSFLKQVLTHKFFSKKNILELQTKCQNRVPNSMYIEQKQIRIFICHIRKPHQLSDVLQIAVQFVRSGSIN